MKEAERVGINRFEKMKSGHDFSAVTNHPHRESTSSKSGSRFHEKLSWRYVMIDKRKLQRLLKKLFFSIAGVRG